MSSHKSWWRWEQEEPGAGGGFLRPGHWTKLSACVTLCDPPNNPKN